LLADVGGKLTDKHVWMRPVVNVVDVTHPSHLIGSRAWPHTRNSTGQSRIGTATNCGGSAHTFEQGLVQGAETANKPPHACVRVCVCVCVRACMRDCVRACVRACVRVRARTCVRYLRRQACGSSGHPTRRTAAQSGKVNRRCSAVLDPRLSHHRPFQYHHHWHRVATPTAQRQ
jgi:hypothetical protein